MQENMTSMKEFYESNHFPSQEEYVLFLFNEEQFLVFTTSMLLA